MKLSHLLSICILISMCFIYGCEDEVAVTGVSLDKSALTLNVGVSEQLTATVKPDDADDKSVSWSSTDQLIATVSFGKVTALKPGEVTIKVSTTDGGFSASCLVTVESPQISVTEISLGLDSIRLSVDETFALNTVVSPTNATNKNVNFASANSNIAKVSSQGIITAIAPGTTNVTATSQDGNHSASVKVIVPENVVHVSTVTLSETTFDLYVSDKKQLNYTIEPENASDKSVTWSSADEAVATVDQNGEITAQAVGSTIIKVRTNDGSKEATCEVNVSEKNSAVLIIENNFLQTTSEGSGTGAGVDIKCDKAGAVYLALNRKDNDLPENASAEVWKYSGNSINWEQVGNARVGVSGLNSATPAVAISDDGTIYASYQYFGDINDVHHLATVVASLSDNGWEIMGGNSTQSLLRSGDDKLIGPNELVIKDDGTLMLAMAYYGSGYVYYWEGSYWKSYNSYKTDSESFWAGGIDIQTYGNTPYVSIRESSGTPMKYGILKGSDENGTNSEWEWLAGTYVAGSSSNFTYWQDEEIGEAPITISSTGDVYACYENYENNFNYYNVKKFDGEKWEYLMHLQKDEGSNPANETAVIVVDDMLFFLAANHDGNIDIHEYDEENNSWSVVGSVPKPDNYYNIELTAGTSGEFYIAIECTGNNNGDVLVYKYASLK